MKKLDWKSFGQFISVLLNLFTTIRSTFVEMGVGIEIVPYLLDAGKESLVKQLRILGTEFQAAQRWRLIDEHTLLVNLEAPPVIPSDKARLEMNSGTGWAKVEKCGDDLFVEGRKVVLEPSNGTCAALAHKFRARPVVHPNIMDALLENQQFVSVSWQGDMAPCVWFWGATFGAEHHSSFGSEYDSKLPRGMQYADGRWKAVFMWRDFGVTGNAAVLEERVPSA